MTLGEKTPPDEPPDTEMDELDELGSFAEKLRLDEVKGVAELKRSLMETARTLATEFFTEQRITFTEVIKTTMAKQTEGLMKEETAADIKEKLERLLSTKEKYNELSMETALEQGRAEGLAEGTKLVDVQKELHVQLKKKMSIMETLHKKELETARAETLRFQNEARDNDVQGQNIADQLKEAEREIEHLRRFKASTEQKDADMAKELAQQPNTSSWKDMVNTKRARPAT